MRVSFVLAVGLLLGACAAPVRSIDTVAVAPNILLVMPSPGDLGRPVDVMQLITARRGSDVYVFEGRLSATAESLLLVGMDGMGQRILTIRWTEGRMEVERAAWLPDSLRPENVLADIILVYWPEASLRRALAASGASLESNTVSRVIRQHGDDIIDVRYEGEPWSGVARLRNLAWNYEIEVRSVSVTP
jgi:hypothetical protein